MGGIPGTQAFLSSLGALDIKEPLTDNQGAGGDFWFRKAFYISANQAMVVPITLPRKPSFFFWEDDNGAVVYATSADRALWNPSQIVVRATTSTTVDLIVG